MWKVIAIKEHGHFCAPRYALFINRSKNVCWNYWRTGIHFDLKRRPIRLWVLLPKLELTWSVLIVTAKIFLWFSVDHSTLIDGFQYYICVSQPIFLLQFKAANKCFTIKTTNLCVDTVTFAMNEKISHSLPEIQSYSVFLYKTKTMPCSCLYRTKLRKLGYMDERNFKTTKLLSHKIVHSDVSDQLSGVLLMYCYHS